MNTLSSYIAILDVGHGNSAILHDNGRVAIIDAGPKSGLVEYLNEQDVKEIDFILISHADKDHIGGLIGLISSGKFHVGKVRLNSDSQKSSEIWDDLLKVLDDDKNIKFSVGLTPSSSKEFDLENMQVEILAPSNYLAGKGVGSKDRKGKRINSNSVSAVIRINQNNHPAVLFPGDLDEVGLNEIAHKKTNITSPVLVFPHHGGGAGTTDIETFTTLLCEEVKPKTVIFSIGRGTKHNTPLPEVVATVRERVKEVRIACTQLSLNCAPNLPTGELEHLNPVFSKGRELRRCCSGTLIIDLDNIDNILPDYSAHQDFISLEAPTALCQ